MRFIFSILMIAVLLSKSPLVADNQTPDVSPIYFEESLPFTISIEESPFTLSQGTHSGVSASYHGEWVILAGRTNGLHGFSLDSFPPSKQNTTVFVIDYAKRRVYMRDLTESSSGLSQKQIDELSVTSPQSFQNGQTLYMCGGYGFNTEEGVFDTKPTFTAINLPKLIKWVKEGKGTAAKAIRQTSNPWMQVTGGDMQKVNNHLQGLLIFGQNFFGPYNPATSNGEYTKQVRRFQIIDDGKNLYVHSRESEDPNPNYRRRDLNVVPIILDNRPGFVALSGVFTMTTGIWTVPVVINSDGSSEMADPNAPETFKQGMSNYVSSVLSLYSKSTKDNYIVNLGGISYGYYENGSFQYDSEFPFINQITTVKMDKKGEFTQYLMNNEFPFIPIPGSSPPAPFLFGAGAYFFPNDELSTYENGVFNLDKIESTTVLGYVVGGIMSKLPNTNDIGDSTASPYIFPVIITPK